MDQDGRIEYFAALCERLYTTAPQQERGQIQEVLEYTFPTFTSAGTNRQLPPAGLDARYSLHIESPTDAALALLNLLDHSPSPHVQFFCLSQLKLLIAAQFSAFNVETKFQLRSSLLMYCFQHPDLQPTVITHLASTLTLLVRMGWLEIEEYRNVRQAMDVFLQASVEHRITGLQMLAVIIEDIGSSNSPQNAAKYRKASIGFRDTQLHGIFEMAFNTLEELLRRSIPLDEKQEKRMKDATVEVLLRSLSFDFTGTAADEANEDSGALQIPKEWQPIFENENFLPTFFNAYRTFGAQSSKIMECLVLIASVRRGLLNSSSERPKFLLSLMQGTSRIILSSQGMDDADNYNGFCRLLYRFRAATTINEMAEKPGYLEWLRVVADFTIKAIKSWTWAPNTMMYLLGFWSRIVKSIAYYSLDEVIVKEVKEIAVEITRAYVTTNIVSVPKRREEMQDDPLEAENEDHLMETLDMLGQIARYEYKETCSVLINVFDPITNEYQDLISQASLGMTTADTAKNKLEEKEIQFAWLVYMMAAFIVNRPDTSGSYATDDEKMDGELTTKVLQLMYVNEEMRKQYGNVFLNKKLDSALICFFQQFKKTFISTSNREVYDKLTESFGISDQVKMIDVIVKKIDVNLQYWGEDEHVIYRTLQLFKDLATGYNALRDLRKIETTRLILENHMSEKYMFLHGNQHQRNRMMYYETLSRVLFTDELSESEFDAFIKPFEDCLEELSTLNSPEAFRQESVKIKLQCIFRDLRGFILPIQSARNYKLFFDWFFPAYTPILCYALQAWSPDPCVNVLLKFVTEFVRSRNQRLHFDVSSANGILVFRDVSQIVCAYGGAILGHSVSDDRQRYSQKYKGISICFQMLALCLKGGYINFGVFWLYQDKAIDKVFGMAVQLMRSVPVQDLMNFPKLTCAFFHFLDEFAREQLMALPMLQLDDFLYIVEACERGIDSLDNAVRTNTCSALDRLLTLVVKEYEKTSLVREAATSTTRRRSSASSTHWVLVYLQQNPQVLPSLLTSLFRPILFDDNTEPWPLSRPLYAAMLLEKKFTAEYVAKVISQQLPERREYVAKELNNLMEGIGWTLCNKDRTRFSQNVTIFRRELSRNNVVLIPLPPVYKV